MVYNFDGFPFDKLQFKPLPRRSGETGSTYYADVICAFDIETSTIEINGEPQSFMYVWQFAIGNMVCVGRTWGEFKAFLYHVRQRLGDLKLCVFVHNLSYEIVFLAGIYKFKDYEVFCTESRKVLKATMFNRFEFRCSYKMTNLSLDALCKRYKVEHAKRSGVSFNYSKVRFPDTPLVRKELMYAVYDVLGLTECVQAILKLNDDDLYSLPLTSTGFVRRNVKRSMSGYHSEMVEVWPDYRCYQLLKSAFRGGNTHANRFYAGEILSNVDSMDISSSYPSVQCNRLFPVSRFTECVSRETLYLDKKIETGWAIIMHVAFTGVELRDKYIAVPYIPIAKCIKLSFSLGEKKGLCVDNGRVLQAAYVEMCLTDIDYKIIVSQYKFERMEILEMYRSYYGPLPKPIIDRNIEYFVNKTALKGVEGQQLYYHKNKELLNSIYGMSVQDPVKTRILFDDMRYTPETNKTPQEIYENKANVAFTQYQYGVWTTAHARASLQAGIDLCGDSLVYVDTDSCKFLGTVDFSKYNKARVAECMQSGSYADDKSGITHYMGVYEHDESYKRFVTLGAKKYAYEDEHGDLHITVSGVSKKHGAKELKASGGLEAFKPGFIFSKSGKTEARYHDTGIGKTVIDGKIVDIGRNVSIVDTTYTLAITDDYTQLLKSSAEMLNKAMQFWRNCQLQS